MNINGIGSNSTISALTALSDQSNAEGADAAQDTASTPASSSNVSKPGELMAKLSQLLQQDPAKFKQVTQELSDRLKAAAHRASGPQAQLLTKMSADFAQASSTGSLASFQAPGAGGAPGAVAHHHHGGGHHGGGAGAIAQVLSNALDEVNQALSGGVATPPAS